MPAEEMYCHVRLGALRVKQSYPFRAIGLPRPNVKGNGYLAGEFPGGTTTVDGVPSSATVRVLFRPSGGRPGDGYVIAETISAPDGTWHIDGINSNLKYDVVGRKEGFNDVIVSNVTPTSMVEITYTGEVLPNETFTGTLGHLELVGGIPPYAASVVDPLPSGIFPVVNGRQLIIDGTTTDDDVFNSTVRITSSNGATTDVPVNLVVGFKAPANLDAESLEDAGAFSVLLTWEVTNTTQEVLVFKSATPFDLESMPAPIATLTGVSVSYTDDDVIEDDVFYYMTASVHESYTRYSDEVREVVGPADQHWDDVVALLQFNGSLADDKGHVFTADGGISYESSPFGSAAVFTGSNYLTSPHSADFSLGNVFTIELFVTVTGATSTNTPATAVFVGKNSKIPANDWNFGYTMQPGDTYSITSYDRPAGGLQLDSEVNSLRFPVGVRSHVAMTSDGTTTRLFHSGQVVASGSNVSGGMVSSAGPLYIGAFQFSGWHHRLQGPVDAIRITKGVARYTEDFTPPTKPFPNK